MSGFFANISHLSPLKSRKIFP